MHSGSFYVIIRLSYVRRGSAKVISGDLAIAFASCTFSESKLREIP